DAEALGDSQAQNTRKVSRQSAQRTNRAMVGSASGNPRCHRRAERTGGPKPPFLLMGVVYGQRQIDNNTAKMRKALEAMLKSLESIDSYFKQRSAEAGLSEAVGALTGRIIRRPRRGPLHGWRAHARRL